MKRDVTRIRQAAEIILAAADSSMSHGNILATVREKARHIIELARKIDARTGTIDPSRKKETKRQMRARVKKIQKVTGNRYNARINRTPKAKRPASSKGS